MGVRVFMIYQHDPTSSHVGGIGTFLNTFIKYSPSDFEISLIGVSCDPERNPVGVWQQLNVGCRSFRFLPVIAARPNHRGGVPITLRLAGALYRARSRVDFRDAILELHRIEPVLSLRGLPNPKILFLHGHSRDIQNPRTENIWRMWPKGYFWLERRLIGGMERVWIVREDAVAFYRALYPAIADRFFFLPAWVDEDVFTALPEAERDRCRREIANRLGFNPEDRFLLFVGRFAGAKDPLLLLETMRLLVRESRSVRLVMIGEGQLEGRIRAFLSQHGLYSWVYLVGPKSQAEIARWMNSADCLVLSSAYEGMPRVVIEALWCGLPVVSTDVGEVRRLVGNSVGGRLVKDHTAESFKAALEDLLRHPPQREVCRRQAAAYTARRVLEPVYSMYRQLSQERTRTTKSCALPVT